MVRTPERRLRGHASFALPHTDSSAATSGVHIATPTIPRHLADARIQSSELAELDLDPSFVVPASVTVVHPQLRDLISCPRERGVVYHVKGSSIVQLTVNVRSEEREDEEGKSRQATGREWWCPSYQSRQISSLGFIPNCLTASTDMLACGGQQGELHLTTLPPSPTDRTHQSPPRTINPWRSRHLPSPTGAAGDSAQPRTWSMTVTLPHASINNSFVLLPPYEGGTPLPTRPGSPVEEHPPHSGIYQGARDSYYSTSPPVATFPNSLPRGSRVHRYSSRDHASGDQQQQQPDRRASGWSSRSARTDDSRRSSEGHVQGGDDGMAFVGEILANPPPMTTAMGDARARVNRAGRGRTAGAGRAIDDPYVSRGNDAGAGAGAGLGIGELSGYNQPTWYSHLMHDSQFPQRTPAAPASFGTFPSSLMRGEPRLLVSNNDHFVKLFALRSAGKSAGSDGSEMGEGKVGAKRLTNVGGVKINTAANHSSLSPDGRTMICVGDNHELYLYEVISGGIDFRLIRTYRASEDAGFSTSWSKDGKKFAVASQDGVVTVWDHRSSDPLAKLYTRTRHDFGRFDYEDSYYWRSASSDGSRRDPARVVKFSPPGSSRDLLVFSEEGEAIHIVDARTFDVQARLELPIISREERIRNAHHPSYSPTRRMGPDGGRVGIAGIDFDPSGDFLYAGTEAVMVEYDLRRHSRRGVGSWVLA